MNGKKLSPASIVILAGGAVIFLASFLAFYKYNAPRVTFGSVTIGGSTTWSAWSKGASFPLSILPALLGLIMALQVALTAFANVSLPSRVLGFDWTQIHLVLGIQAALLMLCFLVRDSSVLDFGVGFWFMLLASIALLVGAVMRTQESPSEAGAPPAL